MDKLLELLRNDHHSFSQGELEKMAKNIHPFQFFKSWFDEAILKKVSEPNAFFLATTHNNQPSTRIVYLKDFVETGLVFYTNYDSQKGKEMAENTKVAAQFFWSALERQVRIEGTVKKAPESLSDAYFSSRPRGSQIGAWASHQSELLTERAELEERIRLLEEKYPNEVPRPKNWGGYVIEPHFYEFWQGRPSRLHDRICFQKKDENWDIFRKNP